MKQLVRIPRTKSWVDARAVEVIERDVEDRMTHAHMSCGLTIVTPANLKKVVEALGFKPDMRGEK